MDSVEKYYVVRGFVDREVFACISDLADHLFGYDEERYASYDDFENSVINTCPNCEHRIEDIDGLEEDKDGSSICPNCGQPIDYFEPRIPEIFEYWIVSPFLGKMLSDHGECVLRRSDGWIWGRCCCGQAIALDYVIEKICEELDLFTDK